MGREQRDRAVLLTGMMGSGKSAVGQRLAARLGWPFIDTDTLVEARAGMTIAEIFARNGERAFRGLEREALQSLPARAAVVALGGGAVVDPDNRAIVRAKGALIWLDAAPATLAARVSGSERPLLTGLDAAGREARLRALRDERAAAYADSDARVDTDARSPDQVCDAVLAALGWEDAA